MQLYRFSPVEDQKTLLEAIKYIHTECFRLCHFTFKEYLPIAANVSFFCHYDNEYEVLTALRKELTEPSDNPDQKFFKLHNPVTIPTTGDTPGATYTHLYIRKPDIYRAQVGDIDFIIEPERYEKTKAALEAGEQLPGARIFPRADLDMIELFNPDSDVLGYVSVPTETERVRAKTNHNPAS